MAPKNDECLLFLPVAPFQYPFHSHFQIVVGDPLRHPLEEVKRVDVPFKECFLLLRWIRSHEQSPRVAQAHQEQLDGHTLTGNVDDRFSPVDLSVRTGIELQGQVHLAFPFLPSPLCNVAAHSGFAAPVALL